MIKNWKTTSAGLLMIIGGTSTLYFAFKTGNLNQTNITAAAGSIFGGIGLIAAKDAGVTGGIVINQPNGANTVETAANLNQ